MQHQRTRVVSVEGGGRDDAGGGRRLVRAGLQDTTQDLESSYGVLAVAVGLGHSGGITDHPRDCQRRFNCASVLTTELCHVSAHRRGFCLSTSWRDVSHSVRWSLSRLGVSRGGR